MADSGEPAVFPARNFMCGRKTSLFTNGFMCRCRRFLRMKGRGGNLVIPILLTCFAQNRHFPTKPLLRHIHRRLRTRFTNTKSGIATNGTPLILAFSMTRAEHFLSNIKISNCLCRGRIFLACRAQTAIIRIPSIMYGIVIWCLTRWNRRIARIVLGWNIPKGVITAMAHCDPISVMNPQQVNLRLNYFSPNYREIAWNRRSYTIVVIVSIASGVQI